MYFRVIIDEVFDNEMNQRVRRLQLCGKHEHPNDYVPFPDEVEAFRGGKTKLQGFFVGQLMKKTGGKADPKLANQILSKKLQS